MNFKEAMEAVQKGDKVTRKSWVGSIHFEMEGENLVAKQPVLETYPVTEETLISDEWFIVFDPEEKPMRFYDIIPFLLKGQLAYREDWKNSYIKYDVSSKCIVYQSTHTRPYSPPFESFTATDWVSV